MIVKEINDVSSSGKAVALWASLWHVAAMLCKYKWYAPSDIIEEHRAKVKKYIRKFNEEGYNRQGILRDQCGQFITEVPRIIAERRGPLSSLFIETIIQHEVLSPEDLVSSIKSYDGVRMNLVQFLMTRGMWEGVCSLLRHGVDCTAGDTLDYQDAVKGALPLMIKKAGYAHKNGYSLRSQLIRKIAMMTIANCQDKDKFLNPIEDSSTGPLDFAMRCNFQEIMTELLDNGAQPRLTAAFKFIKKKRDEGRHYEMSELKTRGMKFLMECTSDPEVKQVLNWAVAQNL